jgi:hypothetical protein
MIDRLLAHTPGGGLDHRQAVPARALLPGA